MKVSRPYAMTTRARSVEQTRGRILEATVAVHLTRPVANITLEDIAERAGVSVQTILRHFGSRAALIDVALEHGAELIREDRRVPVGDVDTAIQVIVGHYEERGDGVLVLLSQEHTEALAQRIANGGRQEHRRWVEEVFAPFVSGRADAEELLDLLVVATDVYTWKLLRRDRGLSRRRTATRMKRLVLSLIESS